MAHRMLLKYCSPIVLLLLVVQSTSFSQDSGLVDFRKHVQPILESRCFECHGPADAKNGFRVDQSNDLLAYVEPGDAESSSLWTDYLVTDDPDMLMPPPTATGQGGLPIGELLVMKTWIEEGAQGQWSQDGANEISEAAAAGPSSTIGKIWAFQGLFHPASVHFPVALLSVSTLFVFLSFFNRATCEPVAFHCLWIGALGAVAACLAGWSYAVYRGYGTGVGFDLAASAIDRHRWAGVLVAVFAVLTVPLAMKIRREGGIGKRVVWFLASSIIAVGVSIAGYQGGELTYGEDHYRRYFEQLFGNGDSEGSPESPDGSVSDDSSSGQTEEQVKEETEDVETEDVETESDSTTDDASTQDTASDEEAASDDEAGLGDAANGEVIDDDTMTAPADTDDVAEAETGEDEVAKPESPDVQSLEAQLTASDSK
jgi:uncharacterized membrane protein